MAFYRVSQCLYTSLCIVYHAYFTTYCIVIYDTCILYYAILYYTLCIESSLIAIRQFWIKVKTELTLYFMCLDDMRGEKRLSNCFGNIWTCDKESLLVWTSGMVGCVALWPSDYDYVWSNRHFIKSSIKFTSCRNWLSDCKTSLINIWELEGVPFSTMVFSYLWSQHFANTE